MKTKTYSKAFMSYLRRGVKKTVDKELALRVAEEQGRKGIDFIAESVKDAYEKAYPELSMKFKAPRA
jgi:hypothetical protein